MSIAIIGCTSADATPTPRHTATPEPTATTVAVTSPVAGQVRKTYDSPPPLTIDPNRRYVATIELERGSIVIELFSKDAPQTVNNFVFLAREGFYDNTTFHRVIPGFMAQGGDPQGTGRGGPGYKFADEFSEKSHERGVISMANSGPNTNGSQFFIMHQNYSLPPNYIIFGQATGGLEVVDAIANTPVRSNARGETSVPTEPVLIERVEIREE